MANEAVMKVKRMTLGAYLPAKANPTDIGWDIAAAEGHVVHPGATARVATGIAVELPRGVAAVLSGRSSLAARGVDVYGGVIDPDYRGEWVVVLHNSGREPLVICPGDRVAQAILVTVVPAAVEEAAELAPSARGEAGFGSSGR